MSYTLFESSQSKSIAMIAHDDKKTELIDWAKQWYSNLLPLNIYATGTTGQLLTQRLGLEVNCLESGPLGGDQQIGALIAEKKLDYLIFFWDPMKAQPHDADVRALLRLAVLKNIPTACNISTANFIIRSLFLDVQPPKGKQKSKKSSAFVADMTE